MKRQTRIITDNPTQNIAKYSRIYGSVVGQQKYNENLKKYLQINKPINLSIINNQSTMQLTETEKSKKQKEFIISNSTVIKVNKLDSLRYKRIDYISGDITNDITNDIQFPPMSIIFNPPIKTFDTIFKNAKYPEEKNVKLESTNILIKGPLSELYKIKDLETFNKKYTLTDNGSYKPSGISNNGIDAVEVTTTLFTEMRNSKLFENKENDAVKIILSYGGWIDGATHIVQVGDYIIVHENEFYRVYSKAFAVTYELTKSNIGGKKKSPTRLEKCTVAELKEKATKRKIKIPAKSKKADIIKLLRKK